MKVMEEHFAKAVDQADTDVDTNSSICDTHTIGKEVEMQSMKSGKGSQAPDVNTSDIKLDIELGATDSIELGITNPVTIDVEIDCPLSEKKLIEPEEGTS